MVSDFLFFSTCPFDFTQLCFALLVENVGEVTIYFLLLHGKQAHYQQLSALIRIFSPRRVPFEEVKDLIPKIKDDFLNWVIFNLNYTYRYAAKTNMFERTLVAQRRGLSRDGREILASHGCLMKRTLYDQTLKDFLTEMVHAQRFSFLFNLFSFCFCCFLTHA